MAGRRLGDTSELGLYVRYERAGEDNFVNAVRAGEVADARRDGTAIGAVLVFRQ